MNLAQLLAARAEHLANARRIQQTAADDGGRELTADELAEMNEQLDAAEALNPQIEAARAAADERGAAVDRLAALEDEAHAALPTRTGAGRSLPDGARARVVGPAFRNDPARGFRDIGEFGLMVHQGVTPNGQVVSSDERLRFMAAASGSSAGEYASAGILLPPQFSTQIWDGMQSSPDNLMQFCDRYTVEGSSLTLPANAETKRTTGNRWGGIRAYWRAEAAQMTASKMKLRDMKLEPHELYVFAYVTDKLLSGAGAALNQLLTRAATDEIMFMVNDSIVEGTGVGKPQGYKGSGATVTVPKEGTQGADTIVTANVNKMWSRCWARSRVRALWFINQDCEPELEDLSGADSSPLYLPPGGINDAPMGRLKGRPVVPIEYAETLGDKGDISLVDLSAYALGVRGTIETAMSIHLRFDYGETAFRFQFEVDGQPWINKPLTPFKGTGTLSPFVNLAERT